MGCINIWVDACNLQSFLASNMHLAVARRAIREQGFDQTDFLTQHEWSETWQSAREEH